MVSEREFLEWVERNLRRADRDEDWQLVRDVARVVAERVELLPVRPTPPGPPNPPYNPLRPKEYGGWND